MRGALIGWALLAWVTPAVIAGVLGWNGIWGSGSAFTDFLIPVPVAGGALHVPSFVAVALLLASQPWRGRAGGLVHGVLLAGALAGVALLLDLGRLWLTQTTDATGGNLWQEQPLGLFVLSDCVLGLLFANACGARGPADAAEWLSSLVIAVAIPALSAVNLVQATPQQQNAFLPTGSRASDTRGDGLVFYFSRHAPGSPAFQAALPEIVARHHPRSNINDEDIAVLFFASLAAAEAQDAPRADYTVCLYQDGTPTVQAPGYHDCFSGHETFSEHLALAYEAQDPTVPPDVRLWLARRDACAGRAPLTAPDGAFIDNQEVRACDPARSVEAREALRATFAGDARIMALLD